MGVGAASLQLPVEVAAVPLVRARQGSAGGSGSGKRRPLMASPDEEPGPPWHGLSARCKLEQSDSRSGAAGPWAALQPLPMWGATLRGQPGKRKGWRRPRNQVFFGEAASMRVARPGP